MKLAAIYFAFKLAGGWRIVVTVVELILMAIVDVVQEF